MDGRRFLHGENYEQAFPICLIRQVGTVRSYLLTNLIASVERVPIAVNLHGFCNMAILHKEGKCCHTVVNLYGSCSMAILPGLLL